MDTRDIELFRTLLRERQNDLRSELEHEAILKDAGLSAGSAKWKLLLSLLAAVAAITVVVQFFI